MSPKVSVLIVSWNSAAHLPRCLAGLAEQSYQDFEVIVVDNASTNPADVDDLGARWPSLQLRTERLDANLGFAAANNIGARLARGEWLALLNPDAFPETSWLDELMKAAGSGSNAFFASRQIQEERPRLLDGEGDAYHVSGLAWRRLYNRPVYPGPYPKEVFTACAAAALFDRKRFLEVGGFDEDYFAYHEDVDLGFRLRLCGQKCVFVPTAVVHHVGSYTSGRLSDFVVYHGHRNLVWTYFKDMPALLFWAYLPLHIIMNAIVVVSFCLQGRSRVIVQAKLDALRGLPAAIGKRRGIQAGRRVS
ncbi:MAG TPA: glycosyltransferase family 2 protein, partial [Anaerolineae bacterium]|nr:glycosyltransferase family 2 protein [Anaerolineae bacterium]